VSFGFTSTRQSILNGSEVFWVRTLEIRDLT